MKKLIGMLLVGMMLVSMVGCESEEEKQARILEAVKTKIETNMINNEAYTILTNKEWSIVKDGDGYIVTLNGTITYLISMPVQTNFTISSDMYITYIEMYVAGECTQFETVEKNPNSKLDI